MNECKPQSLANTAWAFATLGQSDEKLFEALVRAAERRENEFDVQSVANTAWAFASAGEPAPAKLDPVSLLDTTEAQGTMPQKMQ